MRHYHYILIPLLLIGAVEIASECFAVDKWTLDSRRTKTIIILPNGGDRGAIIFMTILSTPLIDLIFRDVRIKCVPTGYFNR